MRVVSIEHDGVKRHINVDDITDQLHQAYNAREMAGTINPSTRNADLKAQRIEYMRRFNQASTFVEEYLERLLHEAFVSGYEAAKLNDGKEFHCVQCKAGFDTLAQLFEHAQSAPDCLEAFAVWMKEKGA